MHCAGTRMILWCTDWVCRVDLNHRVLDGVTMHECIPLSANAIEKNTTLRSWLLK